MELIDAIKSGSTTDTAKLLKNNPEIVDQKNEVGLRPVMMALYYSQAEIAAQLRAEMESVNICEAAALGELDTVKRLMAEKPNAKDAVAPDGFTPLGLAAFFGRVETLTWLLEHGADPNKPSENQMGVYPINSAAANRNQETALKLVQVLAAHGADVNAAQHSGWTPLHQAAAHGFERLVDFLLEHDSNPALKSEDGRTAVDMAAVGGYDDLAAKISAA
jgi:ankyrin repeat protein